MHISLSGKPGRLFLWLKALSPWHIRFPSGCLIRYSNISSYVIHHRILAVMMVGKYVQFLHKVPITQKIKVFDFYPHTDFSLIFTRRRTEIFDFYPHTDLLYYDIISTTSWHVETVVVLF